jgi:hypothetical protein
MCATTGIIRAVAVEQGQTGGMPLVVAVENGHEDRSIEEGFHEDR